MKLSDAMPEWMRGLPPPLDEGELAGLRRVLDSGRVGRFRKLQFVCPKSHRLAEVIAAPEGVLLLAHGVSEVRRPHVDESVWASLDHGQRLDVLEGGCLVQRGKSVVMRVDDLTIWLTAIPGMTDELSCRCGRHGLPLADVAAHLAAATRRVVLQPDRTVE